jgi:hypothetical protein
VNLINLIVILVVIGLLLWAVNSFIPMDAKIKSILNVVVIIAVILWLVSAFLPLAGLGQVRIGR